MQAGCFEAMVPDLRAVVRLLQERAEEPSAVVMTGAPCKAVQRAGDDGCKYRKGSKVHVAVDTLSHLLAVAVTPANEQERAQVGELAAQVQAATGQNVELAYVDQRYTGQEPAAQATAHGVRLEVVKLSSAKRGFVLRPRRWVVERSFAWLARFQRLSRDYERLATTLVNLHRLAFACLLLGNLFRTNFQS